MNMEDFDFYHHRFHMTDDYINFTILKHERILNEFRVKSFLDDLESLVDVFNDINYTNAISSNRKKLGKEVPPFPEMLRKRSAKAVLICFYF